MALLEVADLRTHLHSRRGINKAVNGVSFKLDTGKSLGVVGESPIWQKYHIGGDLDMAAFSGLSGNASGDES